ncbi:hypothetical protein POX_c04372 [Penicillium oxalicum]|nr:hypothetical protein POX_c04372 [Penicillium oxalicum]KAI2791511.1 hypothetical protein POX_c04372 [Penicillium oxalicum]
MTVDVHNVYSYLNILGFIFEWNDTGQCTEID